MTHWLRNFAVLVALAALGLPAAARVPLAGAEPAAVPAAAARRVAKKPAKGGKKAKATAKGKGSKGKRKDVPVEELFDASAPADGKAEGDAPPPPPAGGGGAVLDLSQPAAAGGGGVLDLSSVDAAQEEKAKQEILSGESAEEDTGKGKGKKKRVKKEGGTFDFGGGVDVGSIGGGGEFDFGLEDFDAGQIDLNSPEQARFDKAMATMSDEDYATAAQEFDYFLADPKFADYVEESEYQLGKALYKLGFLGPALKRFESILDKGSTHRRYRKSVEWLFFISRKMADETPVLALLAQFRNVKFPKAYQNEFRYLLAKYLFVQAQRFEVEKLREQQVAAGQKLEEQGVFNFENVDFDAAAAGDAGGFDFNAGGGDAGGGGFDFGGGGGGADAGGAAPAGGGGFDFGGGGDAGGGAPAGGGDGGGFDFGGGGGDAGGGAPAGGGDGGGFDFGGGPPAGEQPAGEDAPVREAAPRSAEEAVRQGLDLIKDVKDESKFGPKARYLEGLLSYIGGIDQDSVNAFLKVVRVLNPRDGSRLDPTLRENAFLSLARVHFGHNQFDRSAYYYDLIDRDSENWLTALFEASWSYYRRGDYEKALGNLLTLHAPFFEKEYFPESQIVKAIIYFEACRYVETRDIVDAFLERFAKVMKEIEKIAESKESSEQLYARIKALQSTSTEEEDDVTVRVVNLALGDPEIARAQDVVKEAEDQLALWNQMPDGFRAGKMGRQLLDDLKTQQIDKQKLAGDTTRRKFEEELYALKALLAQAYRIKIEVVRAERKVIEAKMKGEDTGDEIIPAVARTVVDDEHFYWPYEGEYWRDELGTYQLDFSMCRSVATR